MPLFGKKEKPVEQLASDTKPAITSYSSSRSQTTLTGMPPFEQMEAVYMMDTLAFSLVNKYVNAIAHAEYILQARDPASLRALFHFFEINHIHLEEILDNAVRDVFVFGNAFVRKSLNGRGKLVGFSYLDPKTCDYLRDSANEEVLVDAFGIPKGWVIQKTEASEKFELPYEEISHFKIWSVYSRFLGIGPVEVAMKAAQIKLNMEEALGEAAFRVGFPLFIAYVGDEKHRPTQEAIDSVSNTLSKVGSASSVSFPYYVKVDRLQGKTLQVLEETQYFTTALCSAFNIPPALVTGGSTEAIAPLLDEWQGYVSELKEKFAHLVEDLIFSPIASAYHLKEVPRFVWKEPTTEVRLAKVRRIAALAKEGLITPDRELENYLRRLEGLPEKTGPVVPEEKPGG